MWAIAAIKRTRTYRTLNHWRHLLLNREYREMDRQAWTEFEQFCHRDGGVGVRQNVFPRSGNRRTALIVRNISVPYTKIEVLIAKALQMAGHRTVVSGRRDYAFLRYDMLAGNHTSLDYYSSGDPEWVSRQADQLGGLRDWLDLEYCGVHVGRFVIASALRSLRIGQLDFADPSIRARLERMLGASVRYAIAGMRLLEAVKPDCVLFMDRGYSGTGEVCDLAIAQGIDTLTWNLGYKSDRLVFKRYHSGNQRDHPLTPSSETWRQLRAIPWTSQLGDQIRSELLECYENQDWFSVVGTQFGKRIASGDEVRDRLSLAADRKVAVVFPHILWDGSFFFGEDLFDDYTEWLIETLRAASGNQRVQWVVKLHPAHSTKARQHNDPSKPAELEVIERVFGKLPAHVKLVFPDNELSTYSLFGVSDYVVTVRGTVGIEAALFGIPVVTAGTGRYDRRGFTLDSSTRQEYLQKLAELEQYPRLSAGQVELAERYAYGVFLCRQLALSSASLNYERDGVATPRVKVHCQTRQEWLSAPDMLLLAGWIADRKAEDMLVPNCVDRSETTRQ